MDVEARVLGEPDADLGRVVGDLVIPHQMQIAPGPVLGIRAGDLFEEGEELLVAVSVADLHAAVTVPVVISRAVKSVGGPVLDVVVGAPFGQPGPHRRYWCGQVQRLIWDFSSTHSTIAFPVAPGSARRRR
ncbi:hypothetical protein [Georgenia sp. SYP-B2076]|uniref:hypothetical protein n=1 Tax=Georgenia sp. SYP-B2076 TaxID=2495881 RepID=UPI000F8CA123|nr:hypothetical protein [Georgenia sp. SYP-B2076]